MLLFSILFTFFLSFCYPMDGSNDISLHYLRLAADNDCTTNTMVAGTTFFYNLCSEFFGHNYWIWQKLSWLINALTVLVPYVFLLNARQRRRYAFVAALAMLVMQQRFGCEPYRLVFLFMTIMMTSFIKYVDTKKFEWVFFVAVMLPLIAYTRFPSIFVWPLMIIAFIVLNYNKLYTYFVALAPLLLLVWLGLLCNGTIDGYFDAILSDIDGVGAMGHTVGSVFWAGVASMLETLLYALLIAFPCVMCVAWKVKEVDVFKTLAMAGAGVVTLLVIVYPSEHILAALVWCAAALHCYDKHFARKNVAVAMTVVLAPLFCCAGSYDGFIYDYFSVCYLPYLAVHTQSLDIRRHKEKHHHHSDVYRYVKRRLYRRPLMGFIAVFTFATLLSRFIAFGKTYMECGELYMVNANSLGANLNRNYVGEETYDRLDALSKEYIMLTRQYDEVVFWGPDASTMSLLYDKWPVTYMCNTSSADADSKAFSEFKDYIKEKRPVVIDQERHANTATFLLAIGYKKTSKEGHDVFVP